MAYREGSGAAWRLFRCAPKRVNNQTESQRKSINSYRKFIAEHQKKLSDYKANPEAFDNKEFLRNAPNKKIRQQIIDKRIKHLEKEIKTFQDNIDKILNH